MSFTAMNMKAAAAVPSYRVSHQEHTLQEKRERERKREKELPDPMTTAAAIMQ